MATLTTKPMMPESLSATNLPAAWVEMTTASRFGEPKQSKVQD